jgi:hypothetical protein
MSASMQARNQAFETDSVGGDIQGGVPLGVAPRRHLGTANFMRNGDGLRSNA